VAARMGPANTVLVLMLLPKRVLAFGSPGALPSAVLLKGPLPRLPKVPLAFLGSMLPMFPTVPLALLKFLGSMPLPSTVLLGSPLPSRFLPG